LIDNNFKQIICKQGIIFSQGNLGASSCYFLLIRRINQIFGWFLKS